MRELYFGIKIFWCQDQLSHKLIFERERAFIKSAGPPVFCDRKNVRASKIGMLYIMSGETLETL